MEAASESIAAARRASAESPKAMTSAVRAAGLPLEAVWAVSRAPAPAVGENADRHDASGWEGKRTANGQAVLSDQR